MALSASSRSRSRVTRKPCSTSRWRPCGASSTPASRSTRPCRNRSKGEHTWSDRGVRDDGREKLMNIHEYQGKAVLKEFGLPVSRGKAIFSADEAEAAAKELGGPLWVVKSQIHAGGRGKGRFKESEAGEKGGVRLAKSVEEVKQFAQQMLGRTLVTIQTGDAGKQVNRLYIEDGSDIESEFYLSMLVDRETGRVAFVVSTEGGMDIEAVAHDTPEKIYTFSVDPATG